MKFNFFNILMLLGSIQGIILCLLLAVHPQYKKRSNLFLVLLILTISVQNISNSLIDIGFTWVEYIPLSWTLLIPFTLQYFIIYLIEPNYKLLRQDYLLLLPFAVQLLFKGLVFGIYLIDSSIIVNNESSYLFITRGMEVIAIIWCFYVIIRSLKKISNHEEVLKSNYSELKGKTLSWLQYALKATMVLWVLWTVSFIYTISVAAIDYLSYFNWIGIAVIIYWIGYSVITKRKVFEIPTSSGDDSKSKLSTNTDEYYNKIIQLMEEDRLFLTPELSMDMLSDKVGISGGYISAILNQVEGKNFFDFINSYRVEEVKRKVNDSNFSHYSLLGIALDSGFASKSTFNAVFKKSTGMTPSAYKVSQAKK